MADKLGMTDLARQTILQYRRCFENSTITIGPTVVNFVYEITLEGSDLRPDLKGLGDVTAGNNTFNGHIRMFGRILVDVLNLFGNREPQFWAVCTVKVPGSSLCPVLILSARMYSRECTIPPQDPM